MKSKLLILGLSLGSLATHAQIVDISGASGVPFHISSSTDTLYSMFDTLAGITVTGHDSAHLWVDASGSTVKMQAATVAIKTDITDVILELSDNMKLDFDESTTAVGVAEIKGGLKLGYHSEILNTGSGYTHFTDGEQYRYVEEFENRRSTIIAPSLKNAERDSLRYWSGTGTPADGELYSIHLWDNKTVSFVTGHHTDTANLAVIDSAGSSGSDELGDGKDFTIYNSSEKSYQHVERDNGLEIFSEKFMPQMVDNGRAIVVYYGDTSAAYTGSVTRDSIMSFDGFHDGTITLDITNRAPADAFYRHWHMIGNPYRSSLDLSAYLAEPLTGASNSEVNGYYGGRTVSILTDVVLGDGANYSAGYAVVNAAGVVVGVDNVEGEDVTGMSVVNNLAPGQGFFVFHTTAKDATVTTEFNNSMRSSADESLFKKEEFSEPIAFLNIKQSGDLSENVRARKWNQLAVALSDDIDPKFFNAATLKQDLSINADEVMSKRDINIYTQDNHSSEWGYAIKSVDKSYINKNIPIGFETKVGGVDYEFELDLQSSNLEDYDVFIVDRLLNTMHNISKDGPYRFNVFKQSKQQDRFFMRFGYSEEENFVEEVDIFSKEGNFVYISSNSQNTEIQEFKMYDVSGRLILDLYPGVFQSYEVDIRNHPKGVYFVRVTANNKVYNAKVLNNNNH